MLVQPGRSKEKYSQLCHDLDTVAEKSKNKKNIIEKIDFKNRLPGAVWVLGNVRGECC